MSEKPRIRVRVPETNRRREVYSLWVTEGFFETLGVQPLMGYGFGRKENMDGVIISYRFWRDEMLRANYAVGSQIFLDIRPVTIAGVMPEGFNFPADIDIWQCRRSGTGWGAGEAIQFIGRLRPGISHEQAAEQLKAIDFQPVLGTEGRSGPVLQPLQTFLYRDQRPLLKTLVAAAIMFLALVCAGVLNLLIAQGTGRKQEIVTRLIHGATRRNLVFQFLRETMPLIVVGGLAGWWLSEVVNAWLLTQLPAALHGGGAVNVPIKIVFLLTLMFFVTIIGGLIPSLYVTSLDLILVNGNIFRN